MQYFPSSPLGKVLFDIIFLMRKYYLNIHFSRIRGVKIEEPFFYPRVAW